jgi:TRAP-type C4-dicarboxylate transport system substrate-binding protein
MKKKIIAAFLTLSMMLSLASCTQSTGNSNSGEGSGSSANTDGSGAVSDTAQNQEWKKMELTFSNHLAATAPSQIQIDMLQEKINERMDGAIQITSYANGTLLSVDQAYDGVVNGVADIAFLLTSTCTGKLPELLLTDVPGLSVESGTAAANAMYDYIQYLEEKGSKDLENVVVLSACALAPQAFWSNFEITSIDSFNGKQLYCPSGFSDALLAWGATPVNMPTSELYEATRNGLIDGGTRSVGACANALFDEVADYCYVCPLLYQSNLMIMNRDVLESMPDYQQELFLELWEEVQYEFVQYYIEDFTYGDDVISQNYVKNVKNFDYISDDVLDEMSALITDLPTQYVENLNALGYDGDEDFEMYTSLIEKYNAEYPRDPDIYLRWRNG